MKKVFFIFFMLLSLNTYASNKTIDISEIYDSGFDDGTSCTMKEIKSFIITEMSKSEFILRLEQCRQECKKEYIDRIIQEQVQLMLQGD